MIDRCKVTCPKIPLPHRQTDNQTKIYIQYAATATLSGCGVYQSKRLWSLCCSDACVFLFKTSSLF